MSTFVWVLFTILKIAIFARVIVSWVSPQSSHPLILVLYEITEPILGPLRRIIPRIGMLDISPIVALILVDIIPQMLDRVIYQSFG